MIELTDEAIAAAAKVYMAAKCKVMGLDPNDLSSVFAEPTKAQALEIETYLIQQDTRQKWEDLKAKELAPKGWVPYGEGGTESDV